MKRRIVLSLFIVTGCVCVISFEPQNCRAQVQTLSSSNNSAQSSRSGTQSLGGGTSSLGGTTGGTAQTPLNNTQTPLSSSMGTFQNLNAQNSFIGRSDTAQNAFIGRNNAQSATGGQGQTRNFNRATSGGSQNSLNQRNAGQTGPKVPEFRPQLRVAFTAPPIPVGNVSTSMGSSFDRLKTQHEKLNGVQFQVNADHSVTLRGEVDSKGTRKLVEFLAMLEPGVRKVNNELTVASQK